MKLFLKIGNLLNGVNIFLSSVCAFLIAVLMLLTCYTTIMRYVFQRPLVWGIQIMEYVLFIIPFLGASWLLEKRGHVRVDIVLSLLSPKKQAVANMVTSFIGAVTCAVITWYGVAVSWEHFQEGIHEMKVIVFPVFILFAFIPFSSALLSLEFIRQGFHELMTMKTTSKKD